jgi:Predicted permeases
MHFNVQVLLRAVECVAAFFLVGFLGYRLSARGWFSRESADMLTRLTTSIVIPINLFCTINASTKKEQFLPILHYLFLPSVSIAIVMLIAAAAVKALDVPRSRRPVVITAAACSNTINIGLPINLALFGTDAIPAVLLYYMGNTIVFWTVGDYLLSSGGGDGPKAPLFRLGTVKRFFPPPILAFLAGLALLVLGVKIPGVFAMAGGQVGSMITPLSLLCVGIAIWQTGLKNIRFDRDIVLIAIGRFIVSPVVLVALLRFFPVPPLMRDVFIIQCSLPPMASIVLLAIRYKCAPGFASVSVSLCTLCSLPTVPFFMMLVQWL